MQFFNISHPVIKSLCMRKLSFTLAVLIVLSNHVMSQQWDRHMEVKKMEIRIKANAFTASTFIEIPAAVFGSFTLDRQTALKRTPYYYKVKF